MKLTDSKIKIGIETAGVKKCKKCEEEYPATLGYFYQAKGNVGGLTHICKRCSDNKQYRKRIEDLRSLENVKEVEQKIKSKEKEISDLASRNAHINIELESTNNYNEVLKEHAGSLADINKKIELSNLKLKFISIAVSIVAIFFIYLTAVR